MDEKIVILHLSDLHLCEKTQNKATDVIEALLKDIIKIEKLEDVHVSHVVFTGDLVDAGTEGNFVLADKLMIRELFNRLNLTENDFVYVPGNHEVDVTRITAVIEDAVEKTFEDSQKVASINGKTYLDYFSNRLQLFFDFSGAIHNINSEQPWVYRTLIQKCFSESVGFVLLNSAWKSRGDSSLDKNNIIFPEHMLEKAFEEIKKCDLKICLMHHPMRWVREDQKDYFEQQMGKFDIVLSGHTHFENSMNQIGPNGRTFFSTANKLMPISDESGHEENGYFIYIINTQDNSCKVISRQYYPKRSVYDKKIDKMADGEWTVTLKNIDPIAELTYRFKSGIQKNFFEFGKMLFLSNRLSDSENNAITPFVMPKFVRKELPIEKRTTGKSVRKPTPIPWESLFDEKFNQIRIYGDKESGKTVLCHYLARSILEKFITFKKIPVVIDLGQISDPRDAKSVFWEVKRYFDKFATPSLKYSTDDIETLLINNKIVLIIDNYDEKQKASSILSEFLVQCPISKIFYVIQQSVLVTGDIIREKYLSVKDNDLYVDMLPFSKSQIRTLSKNLFNQNQVDYDKLCERVVACFNFASLPRNPFALTLFLSICQLDSNYEPLNISTMIERYVELLLQKLSKEEVKSKTYDYKSKAAFLGYLAKKMYDEKKYFFSETEFNELLEKYHEKKKFILTDTHFDHIFFDQGILYRDREKVFFRFKCLNHYFLAVYGVSSPKFALDVAETSHFYNYLDFFNYYTGLNRNDTDLLKTLSLKITKDMLYEPNGTDLLSVDGINVDLGIKSNYKKEILTSEPLPEEVRDEVTDVNSNPDFEPELLDYEQALSPEDIQYRSIEILGSVIKNSEDVDGILRSNYLDLYLKGTLKILEYLLIICHQIYDEKKDEIEQITDPKKSIDKKEQLKINAETMKSIIRIAVPIAVELWSRENVGTGKLAQIIKEKINSKLYSKYEEHSLVMLYCDLRLQSWDSVLEKYIDRCPVGDILKITYFKCRYYLTFNYFPGDLTNLRRILVIITEKVMNIPPHEAQTEVEKLILANKHYVEE